MKRSEQKLEDCWKMEDLYVNDEKWQEEFSELENSLPEILAFSGDLSDDAERLLAFLVFHDKCAKKAERIYVYANQRFHEDTANSHYQSLSQKAAALMVKWQAANAFFVPELLDMGEERVREFLEQSKELKKYTRYLLEFFRKKEHVLNKEQEKLLADVSELAEGPSDIFAMFNNADIQFDEVCDENGKMTALTHGNYTLFLENKNRQVRKDAFEKLYKEYQRFENTLASVYAANVKQATFFAKTRKYNSSLACALDDANIPVPVYTQLIDTVNQNLSLLHRYIGIRKRVLKLDKLHMYDVYVPMVEKVERKYTFEEARSIVKEGLKPLGADYLGVLQEGFDNRWIDVYENDGKRSGAYSWGAYGTHPYVLMNYHGNLNHVFTLAHEMGHALHSYYSDEENDYPYAGYKIFVAEVASTCNESLLIHHLLEKCTEKTERKYLLNYFMEQFRGTLFRQTMFAEFEMVTHKMVEDGEVLTAEAISEVYFNLNQKYFGDEMEEDKEIAIEWARIPHFYNPFYVYQYATGFSAAIAISRKILQGDTEVLNGYRKFLQSGSSMDPMDLLKLAKVDMTKSEPIEAAMKLFEELLEEFEKE